MGRVLITGATGFLGRALCEALRRDGIPVLATGRDPAKCNLMTESGFAVLCHDLSTGFSDAHEEALRDVTMIVHCAALSSPFGPRKAFERANSLATQNIVDIASQLGVNRFVHISTPAVYFRFADQFDLLETTSLPKPVNDYAATKRQAEDIVLAHPTIHPIILRPRGIYGRGDVALLPRLLKAAKTGPLPFMRDGTAQTDITHVDDVVAAIRACLMVPSSGTNEIFNISGGVGIPVRRIAEATCAKLNIIPRWRPVPVNLAMPVIGLLEAVAKHLPNAPEPRMTRYGLGVFAYSQTLNIQKSHRMLGWAPQISFEEGLARTFEAHGKFA